MAVSDTSIHSWKKFFPKPYIVTFNQFTSKSIEIMKTPRILSVTNIENLGQTCDYLSPRQGLVWCFYLLKVNVTLTTNKPISKSTGIRLMPPWFIIVPHNFQLLLKYQ